MTERTLLANGRVLTCLGGPDERLLDADVLLEADRIVAVGPGRLDADPASARVVALGGATVLPGLGDAHTHISWPLDFVFDHAAVAAAPEGKHLLDVAAVTRTFLESGYTLIIGAGVTQELDDLLAKDFIDRGYIPGPHIVPSGAMIAEMLTAAVEEADKYGAFLTAHARGSASVAMAARTGVRIIHHACFLDDKALREIEARGDDVWVCPGLHYLYAVVSGHAEPWGITAERVDASGYRQELSAQIDGLKILSAAGVQILSGGDFGHQWTRHGTYAAEMQRYVELVAMAPAAAIHTATRHMGPAAKRRSGQVREGFLADLFVVEGDPTTDVTVLQRPECRRAVIKDGAFACVNPEAYP